MEDEIQVAEPSSPAQPTEPSNEQVQEMLQGEGPKPVQVPKPEQTQTPDPFKDFEKRFEPLFQKQLTPLQRELGQLRKWRTEQEKNSKPAYQPPTVWNEMPPDQQKAYEALVDHIFQAKYGEKLAKYDATIQAYENQQSSTKVISMAQSYAGKDWENVNPFAGQIYTEAVQAAEAGDEGAATFLKELDSTQAGVAMLVNLAKQRYAQSVQAQSQKATEIKSEQAKKVGTALTNTSKPESSVSLDNLPKGNNPEARAARLKVLEQMNFQE